MYRKCPASWPVRVCVQLFGLLCPGHVVRTRYCPGQRRDERLQTRPEADHFKRVVEPAGRDAEVGVVWRHVVNTMVTSWQEHM